MCGDDRLVAPGNASDSGFRVGLLLSWLPPKPQKRRKRGGNAGAGAAFPLPRRLFAVERSAESKSFAGQVHLSMSFIVSDFAAVKRAALCAARVAVGAAVGSSEGGVLGVSDPLSLPQISVRAVR